MSYYIEIDSTTLGEDRDRAEDFAAFCEAQYEELGEELHTLVDGRGWRPVDATDVNDTDWRDNQIAPLTSNQLWERW